MIKQTIAVCALLAGTSLAQAQIVVPVGATDNQTRVGVVLNAPTGVRSADVIDLTNAVAATDPIFRSRALAQLSPQSYSLVPEVSLNAVEAQETNILRYVRDLRGNAERPNGSEVTLDEQGRVGMFLVSGARFGKFDEAVDRPEVKNDNYMVMGGLNFHLSPKSTIGGFGGYMVSDVNFDATGANSKLKNWFAGGYGTAGVGPVYIDAWGSYTDLNWSLKRGFAIGGLSGTSGGRTDGHVWAAGAATGLSFSAGNFEIEPFGAIRYAKVRVNGFDETGSPAALSIGRNDAESLRLNLGGRIGTKFEAGNVTVRPQLRGGWYKEFEMSDPRVISAAFNSGGINSPFSFTTSPLTDEFYNAGAAINIAGNGPLSFVVDYDVQFDDDRQFHAVSLGARLQF